MSLGAEYGDAYENYVIEWNEAEGTDEDMGELLSFSEWLNELDWKEQDEELESGMERTRNEE